MTKLGYSIEEAAEAVGVGRTTMCALVRTGVVESVKIGRRRIVPRAAEGAAQSPDHEHRTDSGSKIACGSDKRTASVFVARQRWAAFPCPAGDKCLMVSNGAEGCDQQVAALIVTAEEATQRCDAAGQMSYRLTCADLLAQRSAA